MLLKQSFIGRKFLQLLLVFSTLGLFGCDAILQTMGPGEYGVIFSKLPRWKILGPWQGGIREKVLKPVSSEIIAPWEEVFRVDTTLQTVSWGGHGEGSNHGQSDYVETRTIDGNEVGLAIEVQYHVDPERVTYVVQKVGLTNAQIAQLVTSVARADIRTHMNVLTTSDFFSQKKRRAAVEKVEQAMRVRLAPEGIIVDRLVFRDYKFERAGEPGQPPDRRYQQQIDETQAIIQETEQEAKKRGALVQGKGQEFEKQEGERKQMIAWARGYARQAKIRGDAYLQRKENEAAQIRAAGLNEVEGMKQRIAALSGPGGVALLRLEIAKALAERKPRFVLINSANSGKGGGIDLNKIDTNELIRQAGIFAAGFESLSNNKTPSRDERGRGNIAVVPELSPEIVIPEMEKNGKNDGLGQ